MRVLLTGADGFIGRTFLGALAEAGAPRLDLTLLQWPATAPPPEAAALPASTVLARDISEPFAVEGSFDACLHLAALNVTNVGSASDAQYRRVNVDGTRHVVRGVRARHLVLMSTAKVYACAGEPLDEGAPLDPSPGYAASKLEAERVARDAFEGERLSVLRPVNVVGRLQATKALVPVFLERARAGLPLELLGAPETPLQLLAVQDLVAAFLLLLGSADAEGTFNLAPRETITLRALAERVVALTGSSSAIRTTPRPAGPSCPVLAERARCVLGWEPAWDAERILAHCAEA